MPPARTCSPTPIAKGRPSPRRARWSPTLALGLGAAAAIVVSGRRPALGGTGDAGPPPAPASTAPAAKAGAPSVKDNIKRLGHEANDPATYQRIKTHEQELEKKIEKKRDQQREDHGKPKVHDVVDLTKSLGSTEPSTGTAGATAIKAHPGDKSKVDPTTPPADKTGTTH